MKKVINIFLIVSLSLFILTSCANSGVEKLSEKALEEKENELTSKQQNATNLTTVIKESNPKTSVQEIEKMSGDTQILTLISPRYVFGDIEHLMFEDFTTHEEKEYECNWDLPAIKEIIQKCEDQDGCPALKGVIYIATLKYKLLDELKYAGIDEGLKPTGKKEKRWVMVALEKK